MLRVRKLGYLGFGEERFMVGIHPRTIIELVPVPEGKILVERASVLEDTQ